MCFQIKAITHHCLVNFIVRSWTSLATIQKQIHLFTILLHQVNMFILYDSLHLFYVGKGSIEIFDSLFFLIFISQLFYYWEHL